MQKLGDHLDFNKVAKAIGMLLESGNTTYINNALTVMSQVGYDTTKLRAAIFDGSAVRTLLQSNDMSTATDLGGAGASDGVLATQKAIKTYVDALLTSGQTPFSDFNASTSTNFPSGATLASRYRVSVAGTVQGVVLQAGDVFYPRIASPSTTASTDWIFVQGNADAASSTVLGLVLLATLSQLQGNAGGDADKVVTVSVFNAYETANPRVKKQVITQNVVVGANTVTHGLGTTAISGFEAADATDRYMFDWRAATSSTVTFNSLVAVSNMTFVLTA